MDVDEVTRGGRPTGNRLLVRLDQVAAILETKVDVPVPAAKVVPLLKRTSISDWHPGEPKVEP